MKSKPIIDPMNLIIFAFIFGIIYFVLWLYNHLTEKVASFEFAETIDFPKIGTILVSIIGLVLLIWLISFLWKRYGKSNLAQTKASEPVVVKKDAKDEKKPDTKPATKRGFWRTVFNVLATILLIGVAITCIGYAMLWIHTNYGGNQSSAELSDPRYRMIEKYEFTEDNIGNYIAVNMKFSNYDYEVRGGTLEGFDANGGKISLDNLRKDFSGNQFYNLKLKPESFSSESRRIVLLIKYPRY